jgi:membrane protease YdiL (CAAX protease family)
MSMKSAKAVRKLPPFFALYMVMLPFVMFFFEFDRGNSLFTNYQIYALVFTAIVFIAASASGHRGISLIALSVGSFLALPDVITLLFAKLLGQSTAFDSDFLFYAANFLSIAAILLYFRASGVSPRDIFISKVADKSTWGWAAIFAVASVLALIGYFKFSGIAVAVNISEKLAVQVLFALVFAIANGLMEELWFRSLIFGAIVRAFPPRFAVVFQAVLFGIIHYDGVPSGGIGVALGFIFGAVLGFITLKAKSILPAVAVHITADFVIGLYLQ